MVGASGVLVNLAVLGLLMLSSVGFTAAEAIATAAAMVSNFFLNNLLTYRDCRLVGWRAVRGLASFMAGCGGGALTPVAGGCGLFPAPRLLPPPGPGGPAGCRLPP